VDVFNDVWPGDAQDVPIVQEVLIVVFEPLPAGYLLIQQTLGLVFANGSAHGSVDDDDALAHELGKLGM
jgi:hypothetical protein